MTYWCHNQPRPQPGDTYPVQLGWIGIHRCMGRATVLPSVAECRYDASAADAMVMGCAAEFTLLY